VATEEIAPQEFLNVLCYDRCQNPSILGNWLNFMNISKNTFANNDDPNQPDPIGASKLVSSFLTDKIIVDRDYNSLHCM
jgi:hypothetical protein